MDYAVKEVAPQVWHVDIAGAVRIIRYRPDSRTFAPWDICTAEGRRLWASTSLESAFRWIEARTGHPGRSASNQAGPCLTLAEPPVASFEEVPSGLRASDWLLLTG
jgi:hypothetical protein